MDAGLRLKRIRENLGLRYRQVEQASNLIAARRGSAEFVVGLSRLADIENKGVVPSLHRLYSLCAIYRLDMGEVLEWYGVDLAQILQDGSYANPAQDPPRRRARRPARLGRLAAASSSRASISGAPPI